MNECSSPPPGGAHTCSGLLCSDSYLFFSRTLAQSSEAEAEGVELLGVKPPKRSSRPEPENFLLPPLSLVCWGIRGTLWPSEPSRLKPTVLCMGGKTREGQGLAEGQMESQSST